VLKSRNYSKFCHANLTGNDDDDGDIEGSGDANMEDNIRPEINTESIEHFGR
jgi:hypothetical protein